jgi:hypothetical protein
MDRSAREASHRPMSMLAVIANAAAVIAPSKPCPFCSVEPDHAVQRAGRWIIGCENPDCGDVQFSGATAAEAWSRWNRRSP